MAEISESRESLTSHIQSCTFLDRGVLLLVLTFDDLVSLTESDVLQHTTAEAFGDLLVYEYDDTGIIVGNWSIQNGVPSCYNAPLIWFIDQQRNKIKETCKVHFEEQQNLKAGVFGRLYERGKHKQIARNTEPVPPLASFCMDTNSRKMALGYGEHPVHKRLYEDGIRAIKFRDHISLTGYTSNDVAHMTFEPQLCKKSMKLASDTIENKFWLRLQPGDTSHRVVEKERLERLKAEKEERACTFKPELCRKSRIIAKSLDKKKLPDMCPSRTSQECVCTENHLSCQTSPVRGKSSTPRYHQGRGNDSINPQECSLREEGITPKPKKRNGVKNEASTKTDTTEILVKPPGEPLYHFYAGLDRSALLEISLRRWRNYVRRINSWA
eukprot:Rmarinus@m.7973